MANETIESVSNDRHVELQRPVLSSPALVEAMRPHMIDHSDTMGRIAGEVRSTEEERANVEEVAKTPRNGRYT